MFGEIYTKIAEISYGPTSIIYSNFVNKRGQTIRVARIEPYNYYIVCFDGNIYILLLDCNGSTECLVVNSSKKSTKSCINITPIQIEEILTRQSFKLVISREVKSMSLEDLINLGIKGGVFQIN